jgi:exonuclease III
VVKEGGYQFFPSKLLSWNVRGLNEENKCLMVRNLFREWKVDIVCFQETKLEVMSRNVVCIA